MTQSLQFHNGRCIAAQVPMFGSDTINSFFSNVIAHYQGKTPAEIAKHARAYGEVIKDWPAPRDAVFGWALMQTVIRLQFDQFATEADAVALELEQAA